MPRSVKVADASIAVTSASIPDSRISKILQTEGTHFRGHYIYPTSQAGRTGNHLDALFIIEPIAANPQYVQWLADDIIVWITEQKLQFDVIFAPAQPAVKRIVHELATRLGVREAYWEYLSGGWFGDHLVEGQVNPGNKVLVFNGVSQQGRCVGERLPSFVEQLGATTVAAAVFAKGTAPGVTAAEKRYGDKLYSTVQVPIQVAPADSCPLCQGPTPEPARPWTELRDQYSRTPE